MNSFYIRQKNVTFQGIKQAELYKKQAEEKVKNIRGKSQGNQTEFEKNQINKAKEAIASQSLKILELKERLVLIENKKIDSEYYEELRKSAEKTKVDNKKTSDKLAVKAEDKASFAFTPYKKDTNFTNEKQLDNYNRKYDSIASSLPEKLRKNLREMPNNKGYIFKGVWFFGELPEERNRPVIMFENLYNSNTFRTHEIDSRYRCVYDKTGSSRRSLVSKEERTFKA